MFHKSFIAATLLLIGVSFVGPGRIPASDQGGDIVELPGDSAAGLADVAHEAFQFQSATVRDRELDSGMESPEVDDMSTQYGDDGEPSDRFSGRRSLETIPVQYPLDDSAYEGEDPTGDDHKDHEGNWRDSSVERPNEEISIDDQPWIGLHKFTFLAQTLTAGQEGFGITSLDMKETFKFSRWPFLFVTPRAGIHFLNGPTTTDLPPELYDFSLDTTVYLPLNDRWTVQLAAVPSLFSDLKATPHAFRMVGRGLIYYRWSQELQLAGGFVYLGRQDITALPAAGFIWTPNDDVKFDIMFPKPKIGYRYTHNEERERWVYVTGELGGGSWAVQRSSGVDDVATYSDYQLLLGIENKIPTALSWQIEAGYVFSRQLQYLSSPAVTNFPSTAVLRLVLSY